MPLKSAPKSASQLRKENDQVDLTVNSCNVVFILMASIQTVRSTARVGFTARSYPALRAALSQDSA